MASVASQLIEKITAHAQSDSLEDAREICVDGTYFPNNLRITAHGQSGSLEDAREMCADGTYFPNNLHNIKIEGRTLCIWLVECCEI